MQQLGWRCFLGPVLYKEYQLLYCMWSNLNVFLFAAVRNGRLGDRPGISRNFNHILSRLQRDRVRYCWLMSTNYHLIPHGLRMFVDRFLENYLHETAIFVHTSFHSFYSFLCNPSFFVHSIRIERIIIVICIRYRNWWIFGGNFFWLFHMWSNCHIFMFFSSSAFLSYTAFHHSWKLYFMRMHHAFS